MRSNATVAASAVAAAALTAGACATRSAHPSSSDPTAALHAASSALTADLDTILNDPVLSHGTWGMMVKSLNSGDTLYARNERKLLLPASNMKTVTLAAAAERLGWDYTYTTRLVTAGQIENGTLAGDLIVVGSGDPSIGFIDGSADRVFGEWADRLKQMGVRTIGGRIIGDDNAFEDQELGFGWSWDDLADDYAAGVGALQFNENAVRVTVGPGPKAGDQAAASADPPGSGLEIVNRATTSSAGDARSLSIRRLPGQQRLEISGAIAEGSMPGTLDVSVDNPTQFFVDSMRRALVARGIDIRGPAVDIDDVRDPPGVSGSAVATHTSPPLSTLAVRMMKDSQNQYAETFQKTLTAAAGTPATAAGARAIELQLFESWGVKPGELIIRDGSGLSRYDFVTADALVTILAHVYNDGRLRTPFQSSLPVAGRDGTLANRMKGTAGEGNVRAKSGSMTGVRTLSGYLTTAAGEPIVFAILANNFETSADVVNKATDAIVVRLASFHR